MVGTTVTARRVTYTIAGQAVASRVQILFPTSSNTLYRLYTDHLGSTVTQSTLSGGTVVGASTYYLPYGSYRGTPPTQTLTDRDFTGQRENRELGLLYYNARFYVPSIGRFASADTIIPDPANPQQFNRYTYSLNSPLNYTDPDGHTPCFGCDDPLSAEWQRCNCDYDQYLRGKAAFNWYARNPEALLEDLILEAQGAGSAAFDRLTDTRLYAENVAHVYLETSLLTETMVVRSYNSALELGDVKRIGSLSSILVGFIGQGDRSGGGMGSYSSIGGHHIHAQRAFASHNDYSSGDAISISHSEMRANGWVHQDMTNTQRRLFKELNADIATGTAANTMVRHNEIAVEALVAGGVPRDTARNMVAQSLWNLRGQGVRFPTNVPWYGSNSGSFYK